MHIHRSLGGRIGKKIILKIKIEFLRKKKSIFLHGEKENFEEYSPNLASTELSFPTLINYSANRCQTYPQTTVLVFINNFISI
jgi:hypothetical protein